MGHITEILVNASEVTQKSETFLHRQLYFGVFSGVASPSPVENRRWRSLYSVTRCRIFRWAWTAPNFANELKHFEFNKNIVFDDFEEIFLSSVLVQ